jgi:solute carrier family 13 (sodium-dependent dicarboxylate transporter), member 2/3/5
LLSTFTKANEATREDVPSVSNGDANNSTSENHKHQPLAVIGAVSGPLLGIAFWFVPLRLDAPAQHTLAVMLFMIVYWISEPVDHSVTALIGCFLFWALHIVKFEVAFSGFADNTPWFLFSTMLMGQAAAQSGLAKRIGLAIMHLLGSSYPRLLLGVILFVFVLNFLVPSGLAQLAIVAPMVIGIIAAFGLGMKSNVARGLFITLSYTCGLFNKMVLAGAASILTRGIVEKLTGQKIYWSQYFIAYLPASLITIFACWLTVMWLYPPETRALPGGYLQDALSEMGPWTIAEKKTLALLLTAIAAWSTDFLHHIDPAVIAIGIGLILTLPTIGVLKTRDIRGINFLLVIFTAGALSMGTVLARTRALDLLTDRMMGWMAPLIGNSFYSASVLYWSAFVYHFFLSTEVSMLSTSLPVIIRFAVTHHYNPVALAMVWNFASGGKLFVYQSTVLILGYSYDSFEAKDVLRVGLVLTVVEAIVLALLVPFYWPLIGLHWM